MRNGVILSLREVADSLPFQKRPVVCPGYEGRSMSMQFIAAKCRLVIVRNWKGHILTSSCACIICVRERR